MFFTARIDHLSEGLLIVTFLQPGVQDSNAARAAVAANYMKACTGLWIVAPINRAVDDKTAKTLLGDSFKRQLKFDGTSSSDLPWCASDLQNGRTTQIFLHQYLDFPKPRGLIYHPFWSI